MYESFFGLSALPFKITPDDHVFFAGAQRQDMLDALLYAIERGEGLITVTGEVGTGKTTLARVMVKRMPDTIDFISIYTPNVSPIDMLYLIVQQLAIDLPAHQPVYVLLEAIKRHLLSRHQLKHRVVLLIDDAQTMSLETLDQIRLLSDWQVDNEKLIQVLLFGQPELDSLLEHASLRQIKDRVVYQLQLQPLTIDELSEYLEFRMRSAGYRGTEKFFSAEVVQALYQQTQGYPRAVNKLADQVLMTAFADQSQRVSLAHLSIPIDANRTHFVEQGVSSLTQLWQQLPKSLLSGLVGIFVVVLLLLTWFDFSSSAPEVVAASPDGVSELAYSASIEAVTPALKELDVKVSQVCDKSIDQPAQTTEKNSQVTAVQDRSEVVLQATALAANKEMAKPVITHKSLAYWQEKHKETLDALVPLALQNKYSIQLLSSSWHLRDKFSITVRDIQQRLPEQRGYYIDYVLADGRLRIAWIYGIYDSAEDAKIALSSFPDSVVMFQPVVVSLKQVVGQMKHQLPHYQSSSKCGNL